MTVASCSSDIIGEAWELLKWCLEREHEANMESLRRITEQHSAPLDGPCARHQQRVIALEAKCHVLKRELQHLWRDSAAKLDTLMMKVALLEGQAQIRKELMTRFYQEIEAVVQA
ncbi:hypothetical protein C8J57DRAFT_1525795 [Mycena rebaudengoi]|nr:hypothetical protein C8J57DRAFT_1525795 [Mycena rebaudengoi]